MTQHNDLNGALAHAVDLRAVVDTVPLSLRTYTTHAIGGNHTDYRRYADGPDALPIGTHKEHLPGISGVHLAEPDVIEFWRATELYRMRTQSHLYEDWMTTPVVDAARTHARNTGRLLADCHGCHTTNPVPDTAERCPRCGREME